MSFPDFLTTQQMHKMEDAGKMESFFIEYMDSLKKAAREEDRSISLIATSPASISAKTLIELADHLMLKQVFTRIIFTQKNHDAITSSKFESIFGARERAYGAFISVRVMVADGYLDAHEQLLLGSRMCWSGDVMRRSEERINSLSIFEKDAKKQVSLGRMAFETIWASAVDFDIFAKQTAKAATSYKAAKYTPPFPPGRMAKNFSVCPEPGIRTRH